MISTFWEIPGLRSDKSLEFLERSLNPISVYDDCGQPIYASQSLLALLKADALGFFDCFLCESTTRADLTKLWQRALQGEPVEFLSKTNDTGEEIACCLQFQPEPRLMFLTARKVDPDEASRTLTEAYERAIARFDHPSLATALISLDGAIVKGNQRLHELLGTSHRDRLYLEEFVHPEDRSIDEELREKLLDGRIKFYTIEKRFISKNNEVIWVNASASLIELAVGVHGYKKYFAVLLEDITESRKIYHALVRTEEKWKALILNSSYLFIQTSNIGQIVYVSPAVEQLLDYQKEELLGRPITELIHPYNCNEFKLAFYRWVHEVQPAKPGIECWWRTKSGEWVSLYIQGQRFPSSLEINGVVISGYNVTDRKRLELELRDTKEKFSSLVMNIPGAAFRCDSTYTMEFVSDSIEAITGYSASAFMSNRVPSYLSIIHPDDISLIKDSLVHAVLDRCRSVIDYRIIHASGRVRWVTERKQGVFDANGSLLWLDGVLLDISDRKRSEIEHQRTETKLRRSEALNRAMVQMLPALMRSHSVETFPNFILNRNIKMID